MNVHSADAGSFQGMLELLSRLHRAKDKAYGDAWRKRGEVLGIFANIARKYDRLQIGVGEVEPAAAETLGDTAGDLCVYAGKYLTWLAETQPDAFEAVLPAPPASECTAARRDKALERVFANLPAWERAVSQTDPADVEDAWQRVQGAFGQLERGLLAQAEAGTDEGHRLGWAEKVTVAWALTDASAWLLLRLGQCNETHIDSVRHEVERIDPQMPK